jgi:beta-glucuronidase
MLYPVENGIREIKNLCGVWRFRVDHRNEGLAANWQKERLTGTMAMAVPASYNDITTDPAIRDHIGDVWYEREFSIPKSWAGKRVVIRVGSATHHAILWINGAEIIRHKGGFLPFEADITDHVTLGGSDRLTLAVNNIVDWSCLPTGEIIHYDETVYPKGYRTQETYFDFFNYSGIHRPVKIYNTPVVHISDLTVVTTIDGKDGRVQYAVKIEGDTEDVRVRLFDREGALVAESRGREGELQVADAHFWQPGVGYLYQLEAEILTEAGEVMDSYRLPVGIRTVEVKGYQFLVNGKPFYFKGFGKHEDSEVHGKGLDEVLNLKDFHLMKWMGANSFRTSHYPYSEEIMRLADEEGMVVIDECPAAGMCFWSDTNTVFREDRVNGKTLEHHLQTIRDMIARDKNHPCVVMWSLANEVASNEEASLPYFTEVSNLARALDPTRPITMVQTMGPAVDRLSQLLDVICINRYFAWYGDHGHLELIEAQAEREFPAWFEKFGKAIIVTEYGADTIPGFHSVPAVAFTEEFQCEFLKHYHKAFDRHDFIIGEHVWAFADFATKQGLTRIFGNRKGVFTRDRHPKAAVQTLRNRWTAAHPKW